MALLGGSERTRAAGVLRAVGGSLASIVRAFRAQPRSGTDASGAGASGAGASGAGRPRAQDGASPGWIARVLALYVLVYAIQSVYSSDFEKALQQMVFFYVPFAL